MIGVISRERSVLVEEQTAARQFACEQIIADLIEAGLPVKRGTSTETVLSIRRALSEDGELIKIAAVTIKGRTVGTVVKEGESWITAIQECIARLDVMGATNGT